ncbi:hypothetical protein GCM10010103_19240 [Streptomyces paradoxus]
MGWPLSWSWSGAREAPEGLQDTCGVSPFESRPVTPYASTPGPEFTRRTPVLMGSTPLKSP